MVEFNHGEKLADIKAWIDNTRLRLPHSRSIISNAAQFDPMERYLLDRLVHAQGITNRIRIDNIENSEAVIRIGSHTSPLTRKGVEKALTFLRESGLKSYFEMGPDTPRAMRFNAAGAYYEQLTELVYPSFQKAFGGEGEVTVVRESLDPANARQLRKMYMDKNKNVTGIFRYSDSGMAVIRARVGSSSGGYRWATESEMLGALTDNKGYYSLDDLANGKLPKRLGPAMFNESHYSVTLNRSLRAGVIDADKFFEAMQGVTSKSVGGSASLRNIGLMRSSSMMRERAVDGAVILNNKLLDDIISRYDDRVKEIEHEIQRIDRIAHKDYKGVPKSTLEDQRRRIIKNAEALSDIANKGGRFSNFRAMGFDESALRSLAGSMLPEQVDALSDALSKGDAIVLPRNLDDMKRSEYERHAINIDRMGRKFGKAKTRGSLASADFISFGAVGGGAKGTLAFTTEIGLKPGGMGSIMLDPAHTFGGVRANVETLTGAPLLFKSQKGGRDFFGSVVNQYERVIEDVNKTGSLPAGYLKDLLETLKRHETELIQQGNEIELRRVRDAKTRATRLLQRAMTGTSLQDPALIKEFTTSMQASLSRAGGKIDPVFTMPSSVWGHVAPDVLSYLKSDVTDDVTDMWRHVGDDYIAFNKETGFVMNTVTASKAYHMFGGFDYDDALESHLRWSKNSAGKVQLHSLTTRIPMSGAEGGVFKVWGFDDALEDTDSVLDYLKMATTKDTIAQREIDEIMAISKFNKEVGELARDSPDYERLYSSKEGWLENEISRIWGGDSFAIDRHRAFGIDHAAAVGNVDEMVSSFIQRNIQQQMTLAGKAMEVDETGYEYAKRIMDRRLIEQIQYMDQEDDLAKYYADTTLSGKKQFLRAAADRGMLNAEGVYTRTGGFDEARLRSIAADPELMMDIKENRILKYETFASYEAWLREFGKAGSPTSRMFLDPSSHIFDGRLGTAELQEIQDLIDDVGDQGISKVMLNAYKANKASPGLLGRSINVNVLIDAMNSSLMEMQAEGLINADSIGKMRASAPFVDTEALIDTLIKGGATEENLRMLNKVYLGQVAGTVTMMGHMEELFKEVADAKGLNVEDLTRDYGLSRELFDQRLGKALYWGDDSVKSVFFGSFNDRFGGLTDDKGELLIPRTKEEFDQVLDGRGFFGRGIFGRALSATEASKARFGTWQEEALQSAYRTIPELAPEIFTQQETEAADYLQNIYKSTRDMWEGNLEALRGNRLGIAILHAKGMLEPGLDLADLANELAAETTIRAFRENFATYDEVKDSSGKVVKKTLDEDSWRVLGAFVQGHQNNRMVNSSVFSPMFSGVQAFFTKRRMLEEYGREVDFADHLRAQFDLLAPETREQITQVALDEYPSKIRDPIARAEDARRQMRRRVAENMERDLDLTEAELKERGLTDYLDDVKIPRFEDVGAAGAANAEVMKTFTDDATRAVYARGSKASLRRLMDVPMFRNSAIGAAGLIGFSFLYQATRKTEEDMLGDELPGGGSYRTPMPITQMDIVNQYVPQASSGVTYNVNVRGGGPDIRSEIESMVGMSSGGSTYNSLPRPSGNRAQFRDIEGTFA